MTSTPLCVCGHHWESHTGHTHMVGASERDSQETHCACCYECFSYRPVLDFLAPVRASAQETRIAEIEAEMPWHGKRNYYRNAYADIRFLLDLLAAEARGREQTEQARDEAEKLAGYRMTMIERLAASHAAIDHECDDLRKQVAALTQALKDVVDTARPAFRNTPYKAALERAIAALTGAQA